MQSGILDDEKEYSEVRMGFERVLKRNGVLTANSPNGPYDAEFAKRPVKERLDTADKMSHFVDEGMTFVCRTHSSKNHMKGGAERGRREGRETVSSFINLGDIVI